MITIGNYSFDGPFNNTAVLQNRAGVYAILCYQDQKIFLIDVGESADVKERIENHDRQNCWKRNCSSSLAVAVLYTPNRHQVGRMQIEQAIRRNYSPTCGSR